MAASVETLHNLSGFAIFICLICLFLDIVRVVSPDSEYSTGYIIAVFVVDLWGLIPHAVLTHRHTRVQYPEHHERPTHILLRLFFVAGALVAPGLEYQYSVIANEYYQQAYYYRYQNQSPDSIAELHLLQNSIDLIEQLDTGALCWGAMAEELVTSTCNVLQARTVLILLVAVLALVETFMYARSNVGTEEWVQQQLQEQSETFKKKKVDKATRMDLTTVGV